jgi:hypothetical protein
MRSRAADLATNSLAHGSGEWLEQAGHLAGNGGGLCPAILGTGPRPPTDPGANLG